MRTKQVEIVYFKGVFGLEAIRKFYVELAKKNHPDVGGSVEAMQAINAEYEYLITSGLQNDPKAGGKNYADSVAIDAALQAKVNAIIHLVGIEIEVCGLWIWVSGETRQYKEYLKANGFWWAAVKKQWYFAGKKVYTHGRTSTMDTIRTKYGSTKVNSKADQSIG